MFAVGDEVTISRGPVCHGRYTKLKVVKLLKHYLELSDGSKWDFNGLPRGAKPNYIICSRRLVPWEEKHERENLRWDVSYSFEQQRDELTFEQLKQLWLIIGPPRKM